MKLRPRFWGSTAALIVGGLSLVSVLGAGRFEGFLVGLGCILGAAAYRSAKRSKLGLVGVSRLRTTFEALAIVAIVLVVASQRNFSELVYHDPFPNLVIPTWAVLAYVVAKTGTVAPLTTVSG